ncbi:Protein NRT1/ PTR FAMILY 5.7, partial [Bienertia sinuspersici]
MHKTQRIERSESSEENYNEEEDINNSRVLDSSFDYKGKIPRRASTGSWKASFFIIAIEFSERLSYFGIATTMILYMTKVMHQDLKTSASSVNLWVGVTTVMPLVGGFLADAYVGRYFMILFSTLLYVMGLSLLTMTQYIPSLKACGKTPNTCDHASKVHEAVYYTAAYLVAPSNGWLQAVLGELWGRPIRRQPFKRKEAKDCHFSIVYVQEYVSWGIGFLMLAITMGFTGLCFHSWRPFYRYRSASGSPFTPMLQVLVAAVSKRHLALPSHSSLLYEVPVRRRFFDKAAIIEEQENNGLGKKTHNNPWRLATVTQVEEMKLIMNIVPVWLTCLVLGVGISQGSTFFVKQASAMNRKMFKHFEVPAASVYTLTAVGMIVTIILYDKVLLPYLRRATGNERGINILTRIGIGMVLLTISMLISAIVEKERLKLANQGKIMNAFWLTPQFLMLGIADGFSLVGMQEYFYEQVPDSMRSLGMAFYLSVIGVGSFLSSFLIEIVDYVTGMKGGDKWIGKDLNHSRLDYFYWLVMNYKYKNVHSIVAVGDGTSPEVMGDKKVDLDS